MLFYVKDLKKTGQLNLYVPKTDKEITKKYLNIFIDKSFLDESIVKLTKQQKIEYNTEADYATTEEIFIYWVELISETQKMFDIFADKKIVHKLKIKDLPLFC